ncbi:MAG: hypothetical protein JXR83_21100 [Deltaproteobacteria bacterium]|nr:hypothetical protein [Deltaproteobacteria bacterium]
MAISLQPVGSRFDLHRFYAIGHRVYAGDRNHRRTEEDITRLLVERRSVFCRHAAVDSYLLKERRRVVGRCTLIQDQRLPDYAQVAFFEALPGLSGVADAILLKAKASFPGCRRVVVGLNAHLNYGCGFLASAFDQPPLFGLPYNPSYYLDYFGHLPRRTMVSYRFGNQGFYDLRRAVAPDLDLGDVTIRLMDRSQLRREMDIYTYLNNACFQQHPYWSDRTTAEDFELFNPFRFLLKEENLIIAEKQGRPVGFLLWYPDFNELVGPGRPLGVRDVMRYHLRNPIKTVRLTEIAVHPAERGKKIVAGMKMKMIEQVERGGYSFTEGGFIFEENQGSMGATLAYISRALGRELEPHRRYCVFDGELA